MGKIDNPHSAVIATFKQKPDYLLKTTQYSLEWLSIISEKISLLQPIQQAIASCKVLINTTKLIENLGKTLSALKDLSIEEFKQLLGGLKGCYIAVVKILNVLQKQNFFLLSEKYLLRASVITQLLLLHTSTLNIINQLKDFTITGSIQELADLTVNIATLAPLITGVALLPHYVILSMLTTKLILSIYDDVQEKLPNNVCYVPLSTYQVND